MKYAAALSISLVTGFAGVVCVSVVAAMEPTADAAAQIVRGLGADGDVPVLFVVYAVVWASGSVWASRASSASLALSRASAGVSIAAGGTLLSGLVMWKTATPSEYDSIFPAWLVFAVLVTVFAPMFLIGGVGWWMGREKHRRGHSRESTRGPTGC